MLAVKLERESGVPGDSGRMVRIELRPGIERRVSSRLLGSRPGRCVPERSGRDHRQRRLPAARGTAQTRRARPRDGLRTIARAQHRELVGWRRCRRQTRLPLHVRRTRALGQSNPGITGKSGLRIFSEHHTRAGDHECQRLSHALGLILQDGALKSAPYKLESVQDSR